MQHIVNKNSFRKITRFKSIIREKSSAYLRTVNVRLVALCFWRGIPATEETARLAAVAGLVGENDCGYVIGHVCVWGEDRDPANLPTTP